TAYKCMLPHFYKLVNSAHTTQNGPVAQNNVTGYLRVVAEDNIVANDTIVCNVAVSHDHAVFTNLGFPPVFGTAVNGYKLTYGGIIAYFDDGIFAFEFKVLRNGRNHSSRKYAAVFADAGAFHDGYVTSNPGSLANLHILVYHREWINFHIGS